jgi:Cys-rich protein (TIGR01571 family)
MGEIIELCCGLLTCFCNMSSSEFSGKWAHGLFSCCFSPCVCLSQLLPGGYCVVSGLAAGKAREESCVGWYFCPLLLLCYGGAYNRDLIRERLQLEGNCGLYVCIHMWCGPCAVCQEYNTVQGIQTEKLSTAQALLPNSEPSRTQAS